MNRINIYLCSAQAVDTAQYVDTLYEWSAFNTGEIGNIIAAGLVNLTESYPRSKIHLIGKKPLNSYIMLFKFVSCYIYKPLFAPYINIIIPIIGHSLGAHIVGAAGRQYAFRTQSQLPRITGLDPANPCFNEGQTLSGLSRGDADFVDVIHSNPGALGKRDPLGDVDFYPNGYMAIWSEHLLHLPK